MDNGWSEWSRHVLKELERLNACYIALNKKVDENREKTLTCVNTIKLDVARLKLKSGIIGLLGGAIPVAIMLLIKWVSQ